MPVSARCRLLVRHACPRRDKRKPVFQVVREPRKMTVRPATSKRPAYCSESMNKRSKKARVQAAWPTASSRPSNSRRPSVPPWAGSTIRSGCGIMPSTLPASLRMPAMLARRAVDLAGIAEGDPAFALEPVERLGVGLVIAVMMGDRDDDLLARLVAGGEGRLAVLDRQRHVAADEADAGVAHQRAGQQPRLGQDLEAVADAEHGDAALRRRPSPRASPAIAPPSRRSADSRHRKSRPGRAIRSSPSGSSLSRCQTIAGARPRDQPQRLGQVAIAIGAREDDDGALHAAALRARSGNSRSPCWRAACGTSPRPRRR